MKKKKAHRVLRHTFLSDDLKTLLKEAVLTGYDLQKDDFDED
jgi:hypothetical protein